MTEQAKGHQHPVVGNRDRARHRTGRTVAVLFYFAPMRRGARPQRPAASALP